MGYPMGIRENWVERGVTELVIGLMDNWVMNGLTSKTYSPRIQLADK